MNPRDLAGNAEDNDDDDDVDDDNYDKEEESGRDLSKALG